MPFSAAPTGACPDARWGVRGTTPVVLDMAPNIAKGGVCTHSRPRRRQAGPMRRASTRRTCPAARTIPARRATGTP
jgi:hypothetical protein